MVIGFVHLAVVEFVDKANSKTTKLWIKVFSPVVNVNKNVGYL